MERVQFRGAHEGEVGRIEEDDRPFTLQVGIADLDKFAVVEGLGFERFDKAVNDRHQGSPQSGLATGRIIEEAYQSVNLIVFID